VGCHFANERFPETENRSFSDTDGGPRTMRFYFDDQGILTA